MRMTMNHKSACLIPLCAGVLLAAGCRDSEHAQGLERNDATFQEAMADYSSGRLEAAIKGFEKAVRTNPANASARFQLAYLLQERQHDYLGAVCNYREYLMLAPESDKSDLAKSRLQICERLLGTELAKKLNLSDTAAVAAENERLKGEVKDLTDKAAELTLELGKSKSQIAALQQEAAKVRKMLSGIGREDEADGKRPKLSLKDTNVLDDDESTAKIDPRKVAALRAEEDRENGPRIKLPKGLEDDPGVAARPAPVQQPTDKAIAKKGDDALSSFGLGGGKSVETKKKTPDGPAHPETYTVAEGDTLYKIALEFYGRRDAWKKIREANKDKISTDGRVRKGDVLRLP